MIHTKMVLTQMEVVEVIAAIQEQKKLERNHQKVLKKLGQNQTIGEKNSLKE